MQQGLRLGVAAICTVLLTSGWRAAAQSPLTADAFFLFDVNNATFVTVSDGSVLARLSNTPTRPGAGPSGIANLTGLIAGGAGASVTPDFLPLYVTIDVGSLRVHVTDVTASPGRKPFHRGTTFVEGLGVTGPGTVIVQPGAFIAVRAALDAEQAVPGFSINLADDFTQERQIGVIGDTNRAYRNRSLSNVVPQAGLKLPAGNTFSFSATNSSQIFSLSQIDTPDGGATVTCTPATGCWWKGYGLFNQLRGIATSLNPATLGVQANAGAQLTVTRVATGTQPGEASCPSGVPPPPPANSSGVARSSQGAVLVWDSVLCAAEYEIRLTDAGGFNFVERTKDIRLTLPNFDGTGGRYQIRSIAADGTPGPLTDVDFFAVF